MALKKLKVFPNGVQGEYWVAEPTNMQSTHQTLITLCLYKDEAFRTAGGEYICQERVGLMDGTYHTGPEIYAFVKRSIPHVNDPNIETNWFIDAEDC